MCHSPAAAAAATAEAAALPIPAILAIPRPQPVETEEVVPEVAIEAEPGEAQPLDALDAAPTPG